MRSACAIGLAILIASGTVHAQPPQRQARPAPAQPSAVIPAPLAARSMPAAPATPPKLVGKLRALDVNHDGRLAPTEWNVPTSIFRAIDSDHDGYVTRPEATRAYLAYVGYLTIQEKAVAFKAMDANKDGKVSAAEFRGPKPLFAQIDANKNGLIEPAEARVAFATHVRQAFGRMVLAAMDTNKDGKITAAEFTGPKPLFARLDRNQDGILSPADRPVTPPKALASAPSAAVKPVPVKTVAKPRPAKTVRPTAAPAVKPGSPKPVARPVARTGPEKKPVVVLPVARRAAVVFAREDVNKDGKIDRKEFKKFYMTRFKTIDRNNDGALTVAEVTRAIPPGVVAKVTKVKPVAGSAAKPDVGRPLAQRLMALDLDQDGKISRAEYAKGIKARFQAADVNHDRMLTKVEVTQIIQARTLKSVPATATTTTPVTTAPSPKAVPAPRSPVKVKSPAPHKAARPIKPAKG